MRALVSALVTIGLLGTPYKALACFTPIPWPNLQSVEADIIVDAEILTTRPGGVITHTMVTELRVLHVLKGTDGPETVSIFWNSGGYGLCNSPGPDLDKPGERIVVYVNSSAPPDHSVVTWRSREDAIAQDERVRLSVTEGR